MIGPTVWTDRHRLRRTLPALIGQAANFAALLVPVLLGMYEAIEQLLFVTAVAAIVAYATTLNCGATYPRLVDVIARRAVLLAGVLGSLLAAVGLLGAGALARALDLPHGSLYGWLGLAVAVQSLYLLGGGHAVFAADFVGLASARLVIGLVNFSGTLAAVALMPAYEYVLLMPALLSTGLGATLLLWRHRRDPALSARIGSLRGRTLVRRVADEVRAASSATASAVIAGLAFHASTLALPALGAYADVWAVVLRLAGGASTLGLHVLAPYMEVRFSRAARSADPGEARAVSAKAVEYGVSAGIITAVGCLALFWLGGDLEGLSTQVVVIGTFSYAISALFFSVGSRFLVIAGGDRTSLLLYSFKAALTLPAVMLTSGSELLLALGLLELATLGAYLLLLRGALTRVKMIL